MRFQIEYNHMRKIRFLFYFSLILIFILSFTSSCERKESKFSEKDIFVMDTLVSIKIPKRKDSLKTLTEVEKEIITYEKIFDRYDPESIISKINKAGAITIAGNNEVFLLLLISSKISSSVNKYFSITLLPVLKFYEEAGKKYEYLPYDPEELKLKTLNAQVNFSTNPENNGILISITPGSGIDLGGIAKGYIVDEAYNELMSKNILTGLINAGGDIRVWGGENKKTGYWVVGIQNPVKPQGTYEYIVKLKDGSITTSGDYERFIYVGEKEFHHIINPFTLLPSNQAHSVTIILEENIFLTSDLTEFLKNEYNWTDEMLFPEIKENILLNPGQLLTTEADALATAIMCMPKKQAREFCNKNNINAIIYEHDYKVFISDSLKNNPNIKLEKNEDGK